MKKTIAVGKLGMRPSTNQPLWQQPRETFLPINSKGTEMSILLRRLPRFTGTLLQSASPPENAEIMQAISTLPLAIAAWCGDSPSAVRTSVRAPRSSRILWSTTSYSRGSDECHVIGCHPKHSDQDN
jgi:hypothetical protein